MPFSSTICNTPPSSPSSSLSLKSVVEVCGHCSVSKTSTAQSKLPAPHHQPHPPHSSSNRLNQRRPLPRLPRHSAPLRPPQHDPVPDRLLRPPQHRPPRPNPYPCALPGPAAHPYPRQRAHADPHARILSVLAPPPPPRAQRLGAAFAYGAPPVPRRHDAACGARAGF